MVLHLAGRRRIDALVPSPDRYRETDAAAYHDESAHKETEYENHIVDQAGIISYEIHHYLVHKRLLDEVILLAPFVEYAKIRV